MSYKGTASQVDSTISTYRSYHTRDSSNCLKIDGPVKDFVWSDLPIPPSGKVKQSTDRFDCLEGNAVRESLGGSVCQLDVPVHVSMTFVKKVFVTTAAQFEWIAFVVVLDVTTLLPLNHTIDCLHKFFK